MSSLAYEIVPILPVQSHFLYYEVPKKRKDDQKGGTSVLGACYSISQTQLPLLPAYAFTDYKIQGRSLSAAIVDLQGCSSLQSVYVMLSGAKSLNGITILQYFYPKQIYQSLSQQFQDEFVCLDALDQKTKEECDKCFENSDVDMV